MLETLVIKNIAIIDSAEISFKNGLNILSGETGAGKSIIIEAISLILGSRAKTELIRSGCEEAVVEGLFDISDMAWIRPRLEKLGFDSKVSELLIKRVIHQGGKHRIYVNGELATLSILQELCEGLVDLCGQHEHQSLTKAPIQLDLLDRYGGLVDQARAVAAKYTELRGLIAERTQLEAAESERAKRADFLTFQIEELRSAELSEGEDERLQSEKLLLQSAETRAQAGEAARQILESSDSDGGGVLTSLRGALLKIRALSQIDERVTPIHDSLERALAETEESSLVLNRYLGGIEIDSERLQLVQDRLSLLADLRRKYGTSVTEMLATLTKLEGEYTSLADFEKRLGELTKKIAEVEMEFMKLGRKLSSARKKVADVLADSVTGELKDLKMGDAKFQIELTSTDDVLRWTASGADSIQFLVQTNRGEPSRPIGKIASGGELSRLMLSIRRVIADHGGIGVYLFDEIDAGIGGQTAFQVGKKLKSVAHSNQVICITHLPQVASFADHHLVVRKSNRAKRTVTEVVTLNLSERREELARMLGGPELTKKSLENASELIEIAR